MRIVKSNNLSVQVSVLCRYGDAGCPSLAAQHVVSDAMAGIRGSRLPLLNPPRTGLVQRIIRNLCALKRCIETSTSLEEAQQNPTGYQNLNWTAARQQPSPSRI
jgi:hypothetical protein